MSRQIFSGRNIAWYHGLNDALKLSQFASLDIIDLFLCNATGDGKEVQ